MQDNHKSLNLPEVKLEGKTVEINYHFTKKIQTNSLDMDSKVIHYSNGLFLSTDAGGDFYGVYSAPLSWEENWRKKVFTVDYLTIPSNHPNNLMVLHIKMRYDNETNQYWEEVTLPNGETVLQLGTFEIIKK